MIFFKTNIPKFILILLAAFFLTPVARADSPDVTDLLTTAELGIKKWNISEASEAVDKAVEIASTDDEKRRAYYVKSMVEFHKGNYDEAREYAQKVLSTESEEEKGQNGFLEFISQVSEKSPDFKEEKSENFIIRYAHPKDRVIAEYGKEVLEKSRYEIGLDLEVYPEEPVIVEIYPDLESFTLASTLPPENVETTGVVGICKFNRIMVLSPRLLPKGYPWADTLAHEYTHYLVFLKSENTVPVWLHEGIAKFQEERWRERKRNVLSPFYETILSQALGNDGLVSIEKMHPSLAMLDSAREAQLAFAQAGMNVSYLVDKWGDEALVKLLDSMKRTDDFKASIKDVTGMDFDTYYASWLRDLKGKGLQERMPGVKVKGIRISNNAAGEEDESEDLVEIDDGKARDHTRLGDLLKSRGRLRSATYEYGKALEHDPGSPLISTRLASALYGSGSPEKALGILDPLLKLYPDTIDIYTILGRIYAGKGNTAKAEESYRKALFINPFDPETHAALISLYEKDGHKNEADRERKILNILISEDHTNDQ
jgi:tetratricopeptide (TPR) repeat protein